MSPTLAKQGRLRGDICNPDYEFLDPRLYAFVSVSTNCSISRLDTRAAGSFSTTEVCVDGTGRHCAAIPSILTSPITNPCCGELPKRAMKFYLRWLKTLFIHSLKIVLRDTQSTLCRNNAGVLSRSFCKNAMLSFSSANVSSCRNLVKETQLVS
jgi:hypothetical protein